MFTALFCAAYTLIFSTVDIEPATNLIQGSIQPTLEQKYENLVERRAQQIARLRHYASQGTFPLNTDFPKRLVPYFVDNLGTHCAVGELLRLDGRSDIVASIVDRNNHVRIEDVSAGPLIDWIVESGLTKAECALIQPSYHQISDYRRSRKWQEEVNRLQAHFEKVERTLESQSELSLREAIIKQIDEELTANTNNAAYSPESLFKSLAESNEPNVRIAAAYALAQLSPERVRRGLRIEALQKNINDEIPEVRFWTAIALEKIGSASQTGIVELHRLTLPVFLATFVAGPAELREVALVQLAKLTPECISSDVQLAIVPEIRRVMVQACDEPNKEIQAIAKTTLDSWRWQRIVFESNRMMRQYLVDTHELESQAAEASMLGRGCMATLPAIKKLIEQAEPFDLEYTIIYLGYMTVDGPVMIAATAQEASNVVEKHFQTAFGKYLNDEYPPSWRIETAQPDDHGLYHSVTAWRIDMEPHGPKHLYIVPKPSMLRSSSSLPSSWFKMTNHSESYQWPAAPAATVKPNTVHVLLGDSAATHFESFTRSCDLLSHFFTYYSMLLVDREVQMTDAEFVWKGRIATARRYKPRFYELAGGGSSRSGGGGWDFLTITMTCDRQTGELTLAVAPIDFPIVQRPESELTPDWRLKELKLMGWKALEGIDFFGDLLLPPEYNQAVAAYRGGDPRAAQQLAYRHWRAETSLPNPYVLMALLSEEAGEREQTMKHLQHAAASEHYDPRTLAEVARLELALGRSEDARKHAQAALELWPGFPNARQLIAELEPGSN